MPSLEVLFGSKRKVFAHFFGAIFPMAFKNELPQFDLYNRTWLQPTGRWKAQGGFLRSRPLGVQPGDIKSFQLANMEREVRMAMARGITGFTYEFHQLNCGNLSGSVSGCTAHLRELLTAAANVDQRFKIVLMIGGMSIEDAKSAIRAIYDAPGMYQIDGKLVVAPFRANTLAPADWGKMIADLRDEGFPIFFMPTFLKLSEERVSNYRPISNGVGTFSTANERQGSEVAREAALAHAKGLPYMAGISPQNYKPKDFIYFEPRASQSFREAWQAAIENKAQYIQLTTWNDFSETTQIAPYTDATLSPSIGTGFYNVNAYYASWYLSGSRPKIERDVLSYFYRRQSVNASAPNAAQPTIPASIEFRGLDVIEVLSFLTEPGTLSITAGGRTSVQDAPAGVTSFQIPLAPGTPSFTLKRNGNTVVSLVGNPEIVGDAGLPSGYADMTYWSGTASSAGLCSIEP